MSRSRRFERGTVKPGNFLRDTLSGIEVGIEVMLTVATFNVKDLVDHSADPRADVEAKLAWTAHMIARIDADVLALQEIGSAEVLPALLARIDRRGGYTAEVLGTADTRGMRCAILSRRPILEAHIHAPRYLDFPVFREGDPRPFAGRIPLRRGVVHACVDGGSLGPLDVLTAHFKSRLPIPLRSAAGEFVFPGSPLARAEGEVRSLVFRAAEALYVRGLADAIFTRAPDRHMAVMGDFNDIDDSFIVGLVKGAGASALIPCAEAISNEVRYSVVHGGARVQIDHILVTPGLRARLAEAWFIHDELREHAPVLTEAEKLFLGGEAPPDPPPTTDSDHAPFVVRFT